MKTCPICHAKTFDDSRICFGCLHDFSKPVADPLMPDLSNDISSYLPHTAPEELFTSRKSACARVSYPAPESADAVLNANEFELPWDEDPEHPTKTMSAEEYAAKQKARASVCEEEEPFEVMFALRWTDGSVEIDFSGDYEAKISSPYNATAHPMPDLGLSLIFDPPSEGMNYEGVTYVTLKESPFMRVSFERVS